MPVWQRNYYEQIIQGDDELNAIRGYIPDNPLKWELDQDNPEPTAGRNSQAVGDRRQQCRDRWAVGHF